MNLKQGKQRQRYTNTTEVKIITMKDTKQPLERSVVNSNKTHHLHQRNTQNDNVLKYPSQKSQWREIEDEKISTKGN